MNRRARVAALVPALAAAMLGLAAPVNGQSTRMVKVVISLTATLQ